MSEEIVKYGKIPFLEQDAALLQAPNLHVFEKFDGGNCQIRTDGTRLQLATRSGDYSNRTREHQWFGQFQAWAHQLYGELQQEYQATLDELIPRHLVLFGEWLSFHTIHYAPEHTDQFHLIDVYDTLTERFLKYDDGVEAATIGGLVPLRTVQVLHRGPLTPEKLEKLLQGSHYRSDRGHKEGLVLKDYDSDPQRFAKTYNKKYREYAGERKGLQAYLTDQRLRKAALRIRNIGATELTQASLRSEFLRDLRSELPADLYDDREVRIWLSRHVPPILEE